MLDTDTCIALLKGRSPSLSAELDRHGARAFSVSAVTLAELAFGAGQSGRAVSQSRLRFLLETIDCLPFDTEAALAYGDVRAQLTRGGHVIGAHDMLIAAHARSVGRTLVTHNVREFARVRGLAVQDWLG
jgi:tRNA(fMet)-specific endonuclease VapC